MSFGWRSLPSQSPPLPSRMFITRLSLAYLLVAMASAYPASQGHGHGHDHSLANGQTCSQSIQCQSDYCRRGACDVKKPNGHACYKNAGCTSGRCDHKKCRPVKSHHTSAPGPTSTPTATGTGTPTSTGSPAGTSFKATETPTGTDLGTSTPTGTDSGTAASTDTGTTSPTATTTPQDTPVNPGELFYSASEGGSDVDTKFGYLNEIDGDNKVHSSSLRPYQGIYEQWLLTPDGYLQGAKTGNVLSTDGRYITTEDQTAAPDGVYPYVCTQGQTVPASGDRGRGTELYCVAAGRYGALLVCQNGDLESDSTGCADRMLVQTINTLYMVEPAAQQE